MMCFTLKSFYEDCKLGLLFIIGNSLFALLLYLCGLKYGWILKYIAYFHAFLAALTLAGILLIYILGALTACVMWIDKSISKALTPKPNKIKPPPEPPNHNIIEKIEEMKPVLFGETLQSQTQEDGSEMIMLSHFLGNIAVGMVEMNNLNCHFQSILRNPVLEDITALSRELLERNKSWESVCKHRKELLRREEERNDKEKETLEYIKHRDFIRNEIRFIEAILQTNDDAIQLLKTSICVTKPEEKFERNLRCMHNQKCTRQICHGEICPEYSECSEQK